GRPRDGGLPPAPRHGHAPATAAHRPAGPPRVGARRPGPRNRVRSRSSPPLPAGIDAVRTRAARGEVRAHRLDHREGDGGIGGGYVAQGVGANGRGHPGDLVEMRPRTGRGGEQVGASVGGIAATLHHAAIRQLVDDAAERDRLHLEPVGELDLADARFGFVGEIDEDASLVVGELAAPQAVAKRPAHQAGHVGKREAEARPPHVCLLRFSKQSLLYRRTPPGNGGHGNGPSAGSRNRRTGRGNHCSTSRLRSIQAVFSCTSSRRVSRSAVGWSPAFSAISNTERAVRAVVSWASTRRRTISSALGVSLHSFTDASDWKALYEPGAWKPRARIRSAISSSAFHCSVYCSMNISCRELNIGPVTFQWKLCVIR